MKEFIIQMMEQYGYFGIFLLIMIENVFPPIPSEVILTFGGFMTTSTSLTVFWVIIFSTIGSVFGAIILYSVGRILSTERLEALISGKLGKALRFKQGDIEKAEQWFIKKKYPSIFFCRFIPIIRSLISIPAGTSKVKFIPFLLLTILGTAIWNTVLVLLGRAAGDAWESIAQVIDKYSYVALIIFIFIVLVCAIVFIYKRFYSKDKEEQ